MSLNRRYLYSLLIALPLILSSCASMYFQDAGKPPRPPPRFEMKDWPYQEYWTGIVFNGAKIGFSHFTLAPSQAEPDLFDIHSDAVMRLRFLAFDKKINLKSYDQVAADLSLQKFSYEYDLDGNVLQINGRIANHMLEVNITTPGQKRRKTIPVADKVYPTSIINLYPLLHGLAINRFYTYRVYDGETQSVSPVEQKILAYEESDLYPGKAFKINTRLHGHEVTTWMNATGNPLLEMSLGGVIISTLESRSTARKYLAQAALNKAETLLDFSRIKSNIPIPNPALVKSMEVVLDGIGPNFSVPNDVRQRCQRHDHEFRCRIQLQMPDQETDDASKNQGGFKQYLLSSYIIPSHHRRIRQTAHKIVTNTANTHQQILLLVKWIRENIKQEPVDVFSALDVLEGQKAECQGHAFLYAALARSLNIPTRVVNGIVYSVDYQGFLYHTWAESLVNGHWIAIDPTFRQVPADATHIKLVEGENISDLIPLVDLIGQIKLRIIKMDVPSR